MDPQIESGATPEVSSAEPTLTQAASPEPKAVAPETPTPRSPKTLAEIAADAAKSLRRQAQTPDERETVGQESSPTEEPPETEVLSQEANNEDSESESDHEPEDRGQLPKGVLERIRKLKAQKKELRDKAGRVPELEAQLAKAQAELEAARKPAEPATQPPPNAQAPTPGAGPLSDITDLTVLEQKARAAESGLEQVEDLLDTLRDDENGAEVVAGRLRSEGVKLIDPTSGEEDWSPSRMREWLRGARDGARKVVKAAPERRRWIEQEQANVQQAVQQFPELTDAKAELTQEVVQLLKERPELRQKPTWPIDAVVGVLGRRALAQKSAAKPTIPTAAPAPKPAVPRVPGVPRSSPTAVAVDEDAELRDRIKSGQATREDLGRYAARSLKGLFKG